MKSRQVLRRVGTLTGRLSLYYGRGSLDGRVDSLSQTIHDDIIAGRNHLGFPVYRMVRKVMREGGIDGGFGQYVRIVFGVVRSRSQCILFVS